MFFEEECSGCYVITMDHKTFFDTWYTVSQVKDKSRGKHYCPPCAQARFALPKSEAEVPPKKEYHPLQKEFGFNAPEDGSAIRYDDDLQSHGAWIHDGVKAVVPWLQFRFWWWLHNCVAHFVIGIVPITATFRFHDYTSRRMHGVKEGT